MNNDDYETISIEEEEDIFRISLDRPQKANTINRVMMEELISGFRRAESEDVRCIVFTGNGGNFCAGADVSMFRADAEIMHDISRKAKRLTTTVEGLGVPVIAGITGFCLGGGLELTLPCDFRFSSEDAKFGNPEINLGIIPGSGSTQRLVRLVGLAKAKEIVMLGERYSAKEAMEMGLVHRVVPDEEFNEKLSEFTQKLMNRPSIALKYAKLALNYGGQVPQDIGLELESTFFGLSATTEDMKEGMEAFVENREPDFEGE